MVKIDIISGFLGAGKTTLIAKLLKESLQDEKVILIENEFGEIGIDSGFLKSTGIEIREMNSGCICCSLVGDFGQALEEVIEKYSPDRVIIEPSGVGKLSDVIRAVQNAEDKIKQDVRINCAAAVVDVLKCKIHFKNFGEFYTDQIESAGTIILSRTDLPKADKAKVDEAVALIREHNPDVTIITTPIEQLSAAKLLKVMEEGGEDLAKQMLHEMRHGHHHGHEDCHAHEHHHDHCHDHEHDHDHDHKHHHEHGHDHDHEHHHEHGHDHGHEHHHKHDHGHEHHHEHDHGHEHHHDHNHGEHCSCGHDHHHGEHCSCGHDHHHDAEEVFETWGCETANRYTVQEIKAMIDTLSSSDEYGTILRAKGILALEDGGWGYFDMVPGQTEVRDGEAEFTGRICVIGTELNDGKIAELFKV